MSGAGAPNLKVDATGLKVAIIAGSWHPEITEAMVANAVDTAQESGAKSAVFHVAGSFELPLAAQTALGSGYDAVVCLGVIIRGETPHFDFVANSVTDGLTRVQLDAKKPVGFGVLTVDDEAQAVNRSGLPQARENKGREAMEAVLHAAATANLIKQNGAGCGC